METKKFLIGREKGCDLILADASVSRKHAELSIESESRIVIRDLGSSRGTFLMRSGSPQRVVHATISRGDTVRFGELEIAVADILASLPAPIDPAAPARAVKRIRCSCGLIKALGTPCPTCGEVS